MKIRWAWFDGGQQLALGVVPVAVAPDDSAFYAEGEETVCSPAVRTHLPPELAALDINRRTAVVEPLVLSVNALFAMGLDLRREPGPAVVLANGIASATGTSAAGSIGSHAGVSLPCRWEAIDQAMATATIDALGALLYALRHART